MLDIDCHIPRTWTPCARMCRTLFSCCSCSISFCNFETSSGLFSFSDESFHLLIVNTHKWNNFVMSGSSQLLLTIVSDLKNTIDKFNLTKWQKNDQVFPVFNSSLLPIASRERHPFHHILALSFCYLGTWRSFSIFEEHTMFPCESRIVVLLLKSLRGINAKQTKTGNGRTLHVPKKTTTGYWKAETTWLYCKNYFTTETSVLIPLDCKLYEKRLHELHFNKWVTLALAYYCTQFQQRQARNSKPKGKKMCLPNQIQTKTTNISFNV